MSSEFERKHHDLLAQMIEYVLRSRSGPILVPDLADRAGFSRFHLARLFQEVTQETLEGFLRRIRLERAAYLLRTTSASVREVAEAAGYDSPEAFSRAFHSAFRISPSKFRRDLVADWKLPSPTDLHWNEHWGGEETSLKERFPFKTEFRSPVQLAVWRWNGNYSRLSEGWEQLAATVPVPKARAYLTLYHDNMWTHPKTTTMRADLGWALEPHAPIPAPMRPVTLPAGMYTVSKGLIPRTDRNDAWSYACAQWPQTKLALDEYPEWPLPFERVRTRIVVAV